MFQSPEQCSTQPAKITVDHQPGLAMGEQMGIWKRAAAIAVAFVAALAGLGVAASPVQASVRTGVVDGLGPVFDDWNDEGNVSRFSHSSSGATGLWQLVLWADGAVELDGTTFDFDDIDCQFGPNTERATRNWQSRHGVGSDGIAGPMTWGRAGRNLLAITDTNINYVGSVHTETLIRATESSEVRGQYVMPQFGAARALYNSVPSGC
jgi:peptidoglycan hydrolase-like protein with peptidoglycan-binding domain